MNMSSQGDENMRNEQVTFDINKSIQKHEMAHSTFIQDYKIEYHFPWSFCLLLNTSRASIKALIVQSQNIRKLNPMNSPNTPPTSATKERKELASSSF